MTQYEDRLDYLNRSAPLREKLTQIHQSLRELFPFVSRIAVAVYDPKTTVLKTYLNSSDALNPLRHYQAPLAEAPSLAHILERGHPRVINNMLTFEREGQHTHTARLGRAGYAASYTMPMFCNGTFFGFVFFNSNQTDVFTPAVLHHLDVFGHLVSLMVVNEMAAVDTLIAAVRNARQIARQRDLETGSHLDRMSRYCRLIACGIADKHELDDEYIESVFMFSPLHDIGKIAIPDEILLKPGKLTDAEMVVMRTHTIRGAEILEQMVESFGLNAVHHVDVLRNIALYHHERPDGLGYPSGLQGRAIPIEARIAAVADVFDALTSRRVYKAAWSNEQALALFERSAGGQFDVDCVRAIFDQFDEVEAIQARFKEDELG